MKSFTMIISALLLTQLARSDYSCRLASDLDVQGQNKFRPEFNMADFLLKVEKNPSQPTSKLTEAGSGRSAKVYQAKLKSYNMSYDDFPVALKYFDEIVA